MQLRERELVDVREAYQREKRELEVGFCGGCGARYVPATITALNARANLETCSILCGTFDLQRALHLEASDPRAREHKRHLRNGTEGSFVTL
jgi:hypothetical protein